jgi:predicted Rossmann fold nucleotide-binding protein DprA/Smf involved in DNA uptake
MDSDPLDIDGIIERCGLPAQVVMRELTFLSLKGVVRRVDAQHFQRRNN